MIDHNHPAVEAAAMTLYADRAELEGWNDTWESEDERVRSNWRVHALEVLTAAREHYTADDLRSTPAGQALMAEAKREVAYGLECLATCYDLSGHWEAARSARAAAKSLLEAFPKEGTR